MTCYPGKWQDYVSPTNRPVAQQPAYEMTQAEAMAMDADTFDCGLALMRETQRAVTGRVNLAAIGRAFHICREQVALRLARRDAAKVKTPKAVPDEKTDFTQAEMRAVACVQAGGTFAEALAASGQARNSVMATLGRARRLGLIAHDAGRTRAAPKHTPSALQLKIIKAHKPNHKYADTAAAIGCTAKYVGKTMRKARQRGWL